MKRLLLSVLMMAILVVPSSVWAQATALPSQSLAWTYSTAEIAAQLINRFEVKYDNGAYTSISVRAVPNQTDLYWDPLPALTSGPHTVVVRACNPNGCGDDSDVFNFNMVAGRPTGKASGIQIIATPQE